MWLWPWISSQSSTHIFLPPTVCCLAGKGAAVETGSTSPLSRYACTASYSGLSGSRKGHWEGSCGWYQPGHVCFHGCVQLYKVALKPRCIPFFFTPIRLDCTWVGPKLLFVRSLCASSISRSLEAHTSFLWIPFYYLTLVLFTFGTSLHGSQLAYFLLLSIIPITASNFTLLAK
ncbi:hypothetical protein L211DRAFT_322647 [Terfezia boudieri ATCC MYA-4762]|uniref:Secreted protein n=1 Tax=Terfezia boudieri ATCC MYA-4762 TaxID=1051890 RepID=A0A3N4LN46_9PEZI|nr:hypothetical protein L211DRAFT_322647 [Terfezia boudieri ATCC MYA-4762]